MAVEVHKNLFVGNDNDCFSLRNHLKNYKEEVNMTLEKNCFSLRNHLKNYLYSKGLYLRGMEAEQGQTT